MQPHRRYSRAPSQLTNSDVRLHRPLNSHVSHLLSQPKRRCLPKNYTVVTLRFEWDEQKAAANAKKYGVMSEPSSLTIHTIQKTKNALFFLALATRSACLLFVIAIGVKATLFESWRKLRRCILGRGAYSLYAGEREVAAQS